MKYRKYKVDNNNIYIPSILELDPTTANPYGVLMCIEDLLPTHLGGLKTRFRKISRELDRESQKLHISCNGKHIYLQIYKHEFVIRYYKHNKKETGTNIDADFLLGELHGVNPDEVIQILINLLLYKIPYPTDKDKSNVHPFWLDKSIFFVDSNDEFTEYFIYA